MSVGLDDFNESVIPRTNTRKALWATAIAIVFGIVFYQAIGKRAFENARVLEQNARETRKLSGRTAELELSADRLGTKFDEMATSLDNELENQGRISELNDRVTRFEEKLVELLENTSGARAQINHSIAEVSQAMALVHQADGLIRDASSNLERFQNAVKRWQMNCVPWLDKALNAKISESEVAQLADTILIQQNNVEDSEVWQRQIETVEPRIVRAIEENAYATQVTTQDILLLREINAQIEESTKLHMQNTAVFESILKPERLAQFNSTENPASQSDLHPPNSKSTTGVTTQQTLQDLVRAEELRQSKEVVTNISKQLEAERTKELERRARLLLVEELKLLSQETDRQVEEARQEAIALAANNQRLQAQNDAEESKRAKLLHEKEFNSQFKSMESMLKPFLSLADTHPTLSNSDSRPAAFRGGPYAPMSFGGIQASTALEPTDDGLEALFYIGGHSSNLRVNIGGFPRYTHGGLQNESVRAQLKQIQEFLRKYGLLMVEKRLLSK